jgi:tight adherence protein B
VNLGKLSKNNHTKKKYKYKILISAFFLSACFGANSFSTVFTKYQIDQIDCASQKVHLFYFYVSGEKTKAITDADITCRGKKQIIKIPPWLDEVVPSMTRTIKWRDPVEGNLTETDMWQAVLAVTYEFLELAKKSFPKERQGAGIPPSLLVREYADINLRFQTALDRVYRARLAGSMQGRGRSLMASFTLMSGQLESILNALSIGNDRRFASAVASFAGLSEDAFSQMFRPPPQYEKLREVTRFDVLAPTFFGLVVTVLLFLALLFFLGRQGRGFQKILAQYIQRSKKWTEDFNRQFLRVKVEFLILGPIVLFSVVGISTGNVLVFLLFFFLGTAVGFRFPRLVLEVLKKRRGKRIDQQLMDGLILLSNSLKSGMDIVQGFRLVSQDLTPPISEEFGLVLKNYQLGTPFEKALEGMTERIESRLLSYMIKAIVLQRQVGGNLTQIFSRIVENIREESKLLEKTKALTAQQKIQSVVVATMPWVLAFIMFLFQKDAMIKFYSTGLGVIVLIFCIIWLGIGMVVVNKFGKVKV